MAITEPESAQSDVVVVSREQLEKVGKTLAELATAQLSLHKLADDMHDKDHLRHAFYTMVKEISRSSVKRLDACMGFVPGAGHFGNFDDELDTLN